MKLNMRSIVLSAVAIVSMCFSLSLYAADEPVLTIQEPQPLGQPMTVGSTQKMTYVLQNTTAVPAVIKGMGLGNPSTGLIALEPNYTTTCEGTVPANGTCSITVTLDAQQEGTVSNQIQFNYGDTGSYIVGIVTDVFNFPITAATEPVLTIQEPQSTGEPMTVGNSQSLTYVLQNSTSSPAVIKGMGLGNPSTDLITLDPNFTTDCDGTVPANGTCSITVNVDALKVGTVSNQIQFNYGDTGSYIVGIVTDVFSFPISEFAQGSLTFFGIAPVWGNIAVAGEETQTYSVTNTSSTTDITLVPEDMALYPEQPKLESHVSFAVVPHAGGPDDACSQNIVEPGAICDVQVTVKAAAIPGAINQTLWIPYEEASQTAILKSTTPIQFNVSYATPLEFIQQASWSDMAINSSQTQHYTIRNDNPIGGDPLQVSAVGALPKSNLETGVTYKLESSGENSGTCTGGAIEPGTSCDLVVTINSAEESGTVQAQSIVVNFQNGKYKSVAKSEPFGFNVQGATLQFSQEPTWDNMDKGKSQSQTYRISNASKSDITLGQAKLFPIDDRLESNVVTSNDCEGVVKAGSDCNMTVTVTVSNESGQVHNQSLIVPYVGTSQKALLKSKAINFSVGFPTQNVLQFEGSQPKWLNMTIDGHESQTYSVKNTSDTDTITLNHSYFFPKQQVVPLQVSFSNDCDNQIAPGATCHITSKIISNKVTGLVNFNSLLIAYHTAFGGSGILKSDPITFIVTASENRDLIFLSKAGPTHINLNGKGTLDFSLGNSTASPITINNMALTPVSSLETGATVTNDCSNTVPAQGSCHITATIDAGSQTGAVKGQSLKVDYTSNSKALSLSTPVVIYVSQPALLTFSLQPFVSNLQVGKSETLTYNILYPTENYQGDVTIKSVDLMPVSPLVSSQISKCGNLGKGGSCELTVALNANETPGVVKQVLEVNYQLLDGQANLPTLYSRPLSYSITQYPTAYLRFKHKPKVWSMTPNSSRKLLYVVQNPLNKALSFNTNVNDISADPTPPESSIRNNCDGIVPAHGDCRLWVTQNSGAGTGAVEQQLEVTYQEQGNRPLISDMNYDVVTPVLTFTAEPMADQTTYLSQLLQLHYTLKNVSNKEVYNVKYSVSQGLGTVFNRVFAQSDNCPRDLKAGVSCQVTAFIYTDNPSVKGSSTPISLLATYNAQQRIASSEVNVSVSTSDLPVSLYESVVIPGLALNQSDTQEFDVQNVNAPGNNSAMDLRPEILPKSKQAATVRLAPGVGALYKKCVALGNALPSGAMPPVSAPGGKNTPSNLCSYEARFIAGPNPGHVKQFFVTNYTMAGESHNFAIPLEYNVGPVLSFTSQPTPQDMAENKTTQTLVYSVFNELSGDSNKITLGTPTVTYGGSKSLVKSIVKDGCEGFVLAKSVCPVTVILNSQSATGAISDFQLIVPYTQRNGQKGTLVSKKQSFSVVSANASNAPRLRAFKFVNNCKSSVWFTVAGGGVNNITTNPAVSNSRCSSNANCPKGASCIVNSNKFIGQCFWNAPGPSDGNYELQAGSDKTIYFPQYDNSHTAIKNIMWSGIVTGRTHCEDGHCEAASCGGDGGACIPGQGVTMPANTLEFTLAPTNSGLPDYYDLTIINGIHLPMSMMPDNVTAPYATNPYYCGIPGNPDDVSNTQGKAATLGGCQWNNFQPNQPFLLAVAWPQSGSPAICSQPGTKSGSLTCGLAADPDGGYKEIYGDFVGYWTADQLCGDPNLPGVPSQLNCKQSGIVPGSPSTSVANLYKCDGPASASCYQNGAQADCCGCQNWQKVTYGESPIAVPGADSVEQCVNQNSGWLQYIQPNLQWMKGACPNAYTYPYDDPTSTFTCPNCTDGSGNCNLKNNPDIGKVTYTVTFCPKGESIEAPSLSDAWVSKLWQGELRGGSHP